MTEFSVWAPIPQRVTLRTVVAGTAVDTPMVAGEGGWWHACVDAPAEVDYGFLLDDDPQPRPDPRSRRQPHGVHGLSRTVPPVGGAAESASAGDRGGPADLGDTRGQEGRVPRPAAGATDRDGHGGGPPPPSEWNGRQLAGSVIYELHIGTFTPQGTFAAAIGRLDHLAELGIGFVELLPVNAFNGTHNWGYDGVLWFAVQESYGGPDGYRAFVDACHRRGIGVIQDVVHNHLGPSGNYLPLFGPYLHTDRANTWGSSVNLDGPDSDEVRRYILDNVRMWLADYGVDGLRLDAVHALVDHRAVHLLEEMAIEVQALSAHLRRPLSLIAESDLNNPRLVTSRQAGGFGLTAQWNDDFHHVLHVALTGEKVGYYGDFGSMSAIAKVLGNAYFHDGSWSSFRGRSHGRPVDTRTTPTWAFIGYAQDHDQIGNRATGDRLSAVLGPEDLAVAAVLVLTGPFTPMLFMGEEWGAATPWQFFTSHPEPELGKVTAEGRIAEFARMGWDPATVPDPQAPQTFSGSKLDWSELQASSGAGDRHRRLLDLHRRLIAIRSAWPHLTDPRFDRTDVDVDDDARWLLIDRGGLQIVVNLGDSSATVAVRPHDGVLLDTGEALGSDRCRATAAEVTVPAHAAVLLAPAGRGGSRRP